MKRFSLFLVVCACLFLTGCEDGPNDAFKDNSIEAKTVKGILTKTKEHREAINGIHGWNTLTFKDGGSVIVHVGPGDTLYLDHYQEIEIDNQGMIISVKCESYEKLVGKSGYQEYEPTEDDLLSANKGLVVERGGGR